MFSNSRINDIFSRSQPLSCIDANLVDYIVQPKYILDESSRPLYHLQSVAENTDVNCPIFEGSTISFTDYYKKKYDILINNPSQVLYKGSILKNNPTINVL